MISDHTSGLLRGLRKISTLSDYDVLYLVNDSVYGPLMPLDGYLERMEDLGAGAFAMVYNPHRRTPHLQSWFIGLDRSVFLSEWFSLFLEGVRPLAGKEDVCMVYECGLTGLLSAHGVRCDALFRMAGKAVYNHVKSAWQAGMPFVKKSAFTRHGGSLGREIRHVLEHAEDVMSQGQYVRMPKTPLERTMSDGCWEELLWIWSCDIFPILVAK